MIWNFGSINTDYVYRVPHVPRLGETIAARTIDRGMGGKGANQSIAAARAGAAVKHIGAVGQDGAWILQEMAENAVDIAHVLMGDTPTGHAVIMVDDQGDNSIVVFAGANKKQSLTHLETALSDLEPGHVLLLQNETTLTLEAAKIAQSLGAYVIYSAAPFSAEAVRMIMPHIDTLVTNSVEVECLSFRPTCTHLVTKGADGSDWIHGRTTLHCPAFAVTPVDTTGAGDCFLGYFAAALIEGKPPDEAMRLGAAASALQVTREGAAIAMPTRAQVDLFLTNSGTS